MHRMLLLSSIQPDAHDPCVPAALICHAGATSPWPPVPDLAPAGRRTLKHRAARELAQFRPPPLNLDASPPAPSPPIALSSPGGRASPRAAVNAAPRNSPRAPCRRSSDIRNGCPTAGSAPAPHSRPFPIPVSPAPSSLASPGSQQVLCPASWFCARGRRRASRLLAPAAWATRTAKAQPSSSPPVAAHHAKVRRQFPESSKSRLGLSLFKYSSAPVVNANSTVAQWRAPLVSTQLVVGSNPSLSKYPS